MPKKFKDPHAAREAERYERPIASRELILSVLSEQPGPVRYGELAELLRLKLPDEREALARRLRAMERDGQLIRNRVDAYLPVRATDFVRGRVIGHPDGFGFLKLDEGGDDLFLAPREMRTLMHGDRIVARVVGVGPRGRRQAAPVEVLERGQTRVIGRYFLERGVSFVQPEDKRLQQQILVPVEDASSARSGQIVEVEIVAPPTAVTQPVGRVVEVLGEHMAPGMEIDIAIRTHALPHDWPDAVRVEAEQVPAQVPEKDKRGRLDVRDMPLVTIDGADAKDFDDAVYCEPDGRDGFRLYVAIADVAAYVIKGSAMDEEARLRGTSVYFPGRVIPMLPEVLSNGLCSINPDEDRLCMLCIMTVSKQGKVTGYEFEQAVMRSHARLTYDEMAAIVVAKDAQARRKRDPLVGHLDDLYALYKVMRKAREKRGAIDFDSLETRIVFGPDRKIERIEPVERNDAHKLIEECMIAANVCAALALREAELPALYRVHPLPSEEKREDLRQFLGELGLALPGGETPQAGDYARLLEQVQERPDAHLIQTVLLRSLMQAVYSPALDGHFGLALEAYAHFTSPIRRYPDLLVHRALKHMLSKRGPAKFVYDHEAMVGLGEQCSLCERRADDATRDAMMWLKCEYMLDRVGEEFDGIVSGVTSFGLFVELKQAYVDGLVHITSLPNDYYHFDPAGHRLTGERRGRVYRLGDSLRVKVVRVSLDDRKIDLVAVEADAPRTPVEEARRERRHDRKEETKKQAKAQPKAEGKKRKRRGGKKR